MTDRDRRVSDRLVELVQIIFAFVLAQGLADNRAVLLAPGRHLVPLAALLAIYVTTILSWIDWHELMERRPYNMAAGNDRRWIEVVRLWLDLAIVVLYAYLLFLVPALTAAESSSLGGFLFVYVLLYGLYVVSGQLRRNAYGPWASQLRPNMVYGSVFLIVWAVYELQRHWGLLSIQTPAAQRVVNAAFLLLLIALVLLYRWRRRVFAARRHQQRADGRIFGVDIDGVLADQVTEILRGVTRRYGLRLGYDDVTDWRVPIADTNIADLIGEAMADPDYVLGMRLNAGAWPLVRDLYQQGRVYVVTARPESAGATTRQWLEAKRIPFDGVIHATEGRKHLFSLDVLIDDYLGNIRTFFENSNGGVSDLPK